MFKYQNTKAFRIIMNILLIAMIPLFMKYIEWAEDAKPSILHIVYFVLTWFPLAFSLFFNMKYVWELLGKYRKENSTYFMVLTFMSIYYLIFCYQLVFTNYIDSWYLIMVPVTVILGGFLITKEIRK